MVTSFFLKCLTFIKVCLFEILYGPSSLLRYACLFKWLWNWLNWLYNISIAFITLLVKFFEYLLHFPHFFLISLMISFNIFLSAINHFLSFFFQPQKLCYNFTVKVIHQDYKSNKMGNQCCETGHYAGQISKNSHSKFQYTFQQDHEQLPNPILQSSKLTSHVPPNEYSERQLCQQPRVNSTVRGLLTNVTLASFGSVPLDHGVVDNRHYQFKRSGNIYQGQWKNNVPHGFGTMYFQKGSVYVGTFIEGVPFGKGRLVMTNGAYYEGQIKYGKANGQGEFRDDDYVFKGQFKDDLKHGEGIQKEDAYTFKGIFQNGEKVHGTYKYENCIYQGEFEGDEFNGKGELQNEDGSQYKGSFKNGRFHGYGQFNWADGSQYRGNYYNGLREGDGQFFNSKNSSISKGLWKEGVLKGEGEYKDYRGKVTKCIWQNGKMTGIKTR